MRPMIAKLFGVGIAVAMLAGCNSARDSRPQAKPDELSFALLQRDGGAPDKKMLTRGRISTKSGEIVIMEPDGSVTEMNLDGPESRDAFAVSEADLLALNANLDLDLSGLPDMTPVRPRGPTAQEKALADFAARTRPLHLNLPKGYEADPEDFQGVKVVSYDSKRKSNGDLVEVNVNLRSGVDAATAIAYANCALANWADAKGTSYARHIRTISDKRGDKVIVGAVFTLSREKPLGLTVMTTKDTLQECKTHGIPAA